MSGSCPVGTNSPIRATKSAPQVQLFSPDPGGGRNEGASSDSGAACRIFSLWAAMSPTSGLGDAIGRGRGRSGGRADAAEDAAAEDRNDSEARGVARATVEAGPSRRWRRRCASRRSTWRLTEARRERNAAISAIRARSLCIRLSWSLVSRFTGAGSRFTHSRPICWTMMQIPESIGEPGGGGKAKPRLKAGMSRDPPPLAGAVGPLRPGTGQLDDQHAAAQTIPQKWRRLRLELGRLSFRLRVLTGGRSAHTISLFRQRLALANQLIAPNLAQYGRGATRRLSAGRAHSPQSFREP